MSRRRVPTVGGMRRRTFLKCGGWGAAVPYFWGSSSVSGQDYANYRIGVGVIGAGGQGTSIGRKACEIGSPIAVADVDLRHAERFGTRFEKMRSYQDYRRVLDRREVDVVTIGTPDHWHAKIAMDALQAGKHVYCEKPLTLTIDEGKKLCRVARQSDRVFQVGTQQRTSGPFRLAVAIARSGMLGHPLTAVCSIGKGPSGGPWKPTRPPEHLDWDFWLGQAPVVPYTRNRCHGNFRWWLEYSGGKLTDWGAHHVDIAHWGLGKEHTGPNEVEGTGMFSNILEDFDPVAFFAGEQAMPNGYNTAQTFHIDLHFEDGSRIHVRHGPGNGVLFAGPNGRIFVNRSKIAGQPIEDLRGADKERMEEAALALYKGKQPRGHMQNLFDCIHEGGEPVSDVSTHHRAVSSCHLCNLAMLLERKLHWDPQRERFVADDEANALLSRPQRGPYALHV